MPPMPPGMGPGMMGPPGGMPVPPQVASMMSSMSMLAKGKPLAKDYIKEAMSLLEKARDMDPKLEGRISTALDVLRGDDEDKSTGSSHFGSGPSSRRSLED